MYETGHRIDERRIRTARKRPETPKATVARIALNQCATVTGDVKHAGCMNNVESMRDEVRAAAPEARSMVRRATGRAEIGIA
jgi:hypothetical protein